MKATCRVLSVTRERYGDARYRFVLLLQFRSGKTHEITVPAQNLLNIDEIRVAALDKAGELCVFECDERGQSWLDYLAGREWKEV